jgi:hypothetical protein
MKQETSQIAFKIVTYSKKYVEKSMARHIAEQESVNWTIEQHREYREKRKKELLDIDLFERGYQRGIYTDLQKFLNVLAKEKDPYGMCECYYEYLVIEPIFLNMIDGWGVENEAGELIETVWYKMNDDYKWTKIETPECFKHIFGF